MYRRYETDEKERIWEKAPWKRICLETVSTITKTSVRIPGLRAEV
jgi:hypothetical protein